MPTLLKLVRAAWLACALLFQSGFAAAEPENGWWWNPDESGRGFFIEMRDGVAFLAGYFYEEDGRATWLASGGPYKDPYYYQGTLQSFRNGQTVFGAYRPPDPATDAGPISVAFSDDRHATVTWPGGTIHIERFGFGEGPMVFRPQTGWWWNPAESGNGYSIEIQGPNAFVVAYMYDNSGNPTWYLTSGPMSTPTHYEGDLLQVAGGQTLTGPYRPPGTPTNLGRVTIDFTTTQEGTITFSEGATAEARATATKREGSAARRGPAPIRPLWPHGRYAYNDQWPYWSGSVKRSGTTTTATTNETVTFAFSLVWKRKADSFDVTDYELLPNSSFTYTFRFKDDETQCEQKGNRTIDMASAPNLFDGLLSIAFDTEYVGSVGSQKEVEVASIFETCPTDDGSGTETHLLYKEYVATFLEFPPGNSRRYISFFYPFSQYTPGLAGPVMHGEMRWPYDESFTLEWSFEASATPP